MVNPQAVRELNSPVRPPVSKENFKAVLKLIYYEHENGKEKF